MALKKNYIIAKRNILNEIRCNNMHLQELRFFTIYLSKIDARKPEETRRVKFLLSDFLAIMELKKINIADLKQTTNNLLCKVVNVPTETGGYRAFQLFKECLVEKNIDDESWYIEIDAHDRALPLMFDFKRDFFTYELWNALRLSSSNQLRMYEILKQYEKIGQRTISVEELKNLLFINENEYPRFNNFRTWVLNVCQKALKQSTDIYFEYELIKKAKGKVSDIRFIITKNKDFIDQLTLAEFIDMNTHSTETQGNEYIVDETLDELQEKTESEKRLEFFSEAFKNEFTIEQIELLYLLSVSVIRKQVSAISSIEEFNLKTYDYFSLKYTHLNTAKNVKHRFGYLKKLIELDVKQENNIN